MSNLELFYTLKIQAKNTSPLERVGDFFLTPVHYLWDGRKVDWIQNGEEQIACQFAPLYPKGNWLKTAWMIAALIPGIILGTLIKAPVFFFHKSKHDAFILKAYNQRPNRTFYALQKDGQDSTLFTEKLDNLQKACKDRLTLTAKEAEAPVFFSEISTIHLRRVHDQPNETEKKTAEQNKRILENLELMWNLKTLYTNGYKIEEETFQEIKERFPRLKIDETTGRGN
jgi:hypothetical protein